jgi:uncharacterized protein
MSQQRKKLDSVLIKPAGPDCNMACSYCFYLDKSELFPDVKKHRMTDAMLEEVLRQLLDQPLRELSIGWQGGEPTLMGLSFFQKAVDLQQKFGRGQVVGNGLQTNGILIDQNWAEFLKTYKFLVGLSLDGPQHIHDHYRVLASGKGSWDRVVESAQLLLAIGVAVNALTVVNDFSVRFPDEIYSFHKNLGLEYMQFIPCLETDPDGPSRAAPFSVPAADYGDFLCRVFDLWIEDFSRGRPTTSIRFFDSLFYLYVNLPPPECTLLRECGNYVVVEHNGDVYSCDFFVEDRWRLGNVLEGRLLNMLNSQKQREFGEMKKNLPQACLSCEWLRYCRGGCTKDRLLDPRERKLNFFCDAFRQFFAHADGRMQILAQNWKREQEAERLIAGRKPGAEGNGKQNKIGRNDPCPCGSGKKFKKCCGSG